jgi:hypothetical protein
VRPTGLVDGDERQGDAQPLRDVPLGETLDERDRQHGSQ